MGGATLILGLLPTYAQVGVAAPLLLMLMRLIQGFSLGGEFTGSMVYTTEQSSPLMRGLVSSSTAAGTTIGFILGSGAAWLVNVWLPAEQVTSWGWRIPFVGSVVFLIVGYLLRRGITETAEGMKAAAVRAPLLPSLAGDWLPILQTFGIVAMTNAAYYLTFTYAVERRKSLGGESGTEFLLVNTLVLFLIVLPCAPAVARQDWPAAVSIHRGDDGAHLCRCADVTDRRRRAAGKSCSPSDPALGCRARWWRSSAAHPRHVDELRTSAPWQARRRSCRRG
jgi:MHS family proline/betaine transporter-like MFS transporter